MRNSKKQVPSPDFGHGGGGGHEKEPESERCITLPIDRNKIERNKIVRNKIDGN